MTPSKVNGQTRNMICDLLITTPSQLFTSISQADPATMLHCARTVPYLSSIFTTGQRRHASIIRKFPRVNHRVQLAHLDRIPGITSPYFRRHGQTPHGLIIGPDGGNAPGKFVDALWLRDLCSSPSLSGARRLTRMLTMPTCARHMRHMCKSEHKAEKL